MGRILILFFFTSLAQDSFIEGEYNRCFLKDCRELSVLKLTNEKSVVFNSFMEGRKFKFKNIGEWSYADSIVSFEVSTMYDEIVSKNYLIKTWDDNIYLIHNEEIKNWPSIISEINLRLENDESIQEIISRTVINSEEDIVRRDYAILKLKYRVILSIISDHNIMIRNKMKSW